MNVTNIKQAVRERDGYCCTICGMLQEEHIAKYGKGLEVHRVTPGSEYRLDDSCVTVCRRCHGPLPKTRRSDWKPPVPGKPIHVCLSLPVAERLDRFVAAQLCPPLRTTTVARALDKFLSENGF